MELKSRIQTTLYASFTAESGGTIPGVWRGEGVRCGLASVQGGGITVWQCWGCERGPGTGAISHGDAEQDGQGLTDPLLSCPVPEAQTRVPWRPPGYGKIQYGMLAGSGRDRSTREQNQRGTATLKAQAGHLSPPLK